MHRFFLPPEACAQEFCRLSEPDVRHAQQVLRLKPGDSVQIIDGQGGVLEGRTEDIQRQSVTVQVTHRRVQR
ncbi:MAG TPA: 16S rRNA (uracil(1498)-N(3))-methyltransferase, partial [Verrucomicrobiales bacterium]|nr:16S rRNA (uracil(1498)-N(3))-methyltransferase [Verrucomicrobiales bacterium]